MIILSHKVIDDGVLSSLKGFKTASEPLCYARYESRWKFIKIRVKGGAGKMHLDRSFRFRQSTFGHIKELR